MLQDYHVILLHKTDESNLVYDLDTQLSFPCRFDEYIRKAIGSEEDMNSRFHRYQQSFEE